MVAFAALVLAVLVAQIALARGAGGSDVPAAKASSVSAAKFKKLKRQVASLQQQVDTLARQPGPQGPAGQNGSPGIDAAAPSGAVMFFNLLGCPAGWSELTAARGRYIVGLPSGGSLAATAGSALANLENRPVGQHNHTITDPGHTHGVSVSTVLTNSGTSVGQLVSSGGSFTVFSATLGINNATTGITINNAGSVAGTNAPYIQLLACQKS